MLFESDRSSRIRVLSNSQAGAIALEVAISIGVLLVTLLAGADLLRISYISSACQFVANKVVRELIVDNPPTGCAGTRESCFEKRAIDLGINLGLSLDAERDVCIDVDTVATCDPHSPDNAGTSGDLIQVEISQNLTLLFPPGLSHRITAFSVGRNEPFN